MGFCWGVSWGDPWRVFSTLTDWYNNNRTEQSEGKLHQIPLSYSLWPEKTNSLKFCCCFFLFVYFAKKKRLTFQKKPMKLHNVKLAFLIFKNLVKSLWLRKPIPESFAVASFCFIYFAKKTVDLSKNCEIAPRKTFIAYSQKCRQIVVTQKTNSRKFCCCFFLFVYFAKKKGWPFKKEP